MNTSEVLDLSKENIQPLRQGRKAAHLKTALQAQIDPEVQQMLQKQREKYEYNVRMYEGDDPLEPYFNYVIWLEQSFPKTGRESNLIPLLEDVLTRFKECEKYKQDPRLVQLLVKYISVLSNPVEIYQLVYDQGLGTMCSLLYKAWAEELDKVNDIKRADQVYQLGISCRAQPLEELQNAHVQFQLSIARRMIEGSLNGAAAANEPSRIVLSKLQPSRVKTSRMSKDTAGVLQNRKPNSKVSNSTAPKFQVYQEDSNDGLPKSELKKHNKFPKGSITDRENTMPAGKWCGQKVRQSSRLSLMSSTPSFQIHEDADAAYQTVKTDFRPRALKVRKEEYNIPVAVFEPADPTKKTMYPKQLVYVGGRDIQLEEIQAARYWKMVEKEELEKAIMNESNGIDISTNEAQREHQMSGNTACMTPARESGRLDLARETATKFGTNSVAASGSSAPVIESPSFDIATKTTQEVSGFEKFDFYKPCSIEKNPIPENHAAPSQKNVPEKHNISAFHHSPSTSMTVNTRAAMNIIQQMWESPLSQIPEKPDEFPNAPSNKYPFPVFSDDAAPKIDRNLFDGFCDESIPKREPAQFEVFDDENASKPTPFTVFNDDAVSNSKPPSLTVFSDKTASEAAPFAVYSNEESASKPKVHSFPIHCDDPIEAGAGLKLAYSHKNLFANLWENVAPKESKNPFELFHGDGAFPPTDSFALNFDDAAPKKLVDPFRLNFQNTALKSKSFFPVFCDETDSDGPVNIADGFAKPRILSKHYSEDDDLAKPMSSLRVMAAEQTTGSTPLPLIVPVNLQDTPLEPENKENRPPKDYSTPSERRPLSGILTPAMNVPMNEMLSDDSDNDDDRRVRTHHVEMDEETCTTRAFAIPLPASTPFSRAEYSRSSRKSLLYDGSYIADENFTSSSGTKTGQKMPNTGLQQQQQSLESSKRTNWLAPNLSLILENSKELGGFSSSSSGNAGSKYMTS